MTGLGYLNEKPANVLVVGGGGIGAIAALNLDSGRRAKVTIVLRSNYNAVEKDGYQIKSIDHGHLKGWRPHRGVCAIEKSGKSIVVLTSDLN